MGLIMAREWTLRLLSGPYVQREYSLMYLGRQVHEHARERYGRHAWIMGALVGARDARPYLLHVSYFPLSLLLSFPPKNPFLTNSNSSFGAAFTPYYRLLGPYRSALAPSIVRTELWDTITRRGVLGNLSMGIIPMITYGIISALALVVEVLWAAVGRPGAKRWGVPRGWLDRDT